MSAKPLFERIALLGLGHIASSIALGARKHGLAGHIAGHARTKATMETAKAIGFVDSIHERPGGAVKNADLVMLCVPVGSCGPLAQEIAPDLKPGAILSDVGSVKMAVIRDVAPHVPEGVHFVPGHPVAGTEHSGPTSGFAELFEGRWNILTPDHGADAVAVKKLKTFWEALGAKVEIMDAKHHDIVLATVSHVPHLIAYNIVGTAADLEEVTKGEVIKFSASGFRDFTRIAASDPTMWRDIFLNNREAVLEVLGRFTEDLARLQRAVRWGRGEELFEFFTRTRAIRKEVIEAGQDTPAPDFGRRGPPKTNA